MARAATNGEKTLFRTPGQWSRLWLAVYVPNSIYTARLDTTPASNDLISEITFISGSGTLANIQPGMTLWVGSTAGAKDLGICRIRKAPIAGTFYIAQISDVDWQASCYLTVVDMFLLDQRPPLVDAGILYMDTDTAYTDEHEDFDPVPVLGSHAIAWLTGADVDVEFDGSDSWVFDSTISAYSWTAPGSASIANAATAAPTITYDATGYYSVYCTVTAANGKSFTGVRHVFVYDSASLPHKVELVSPPSADYETGGWTFAVKFYASAAPASITEGALAVLFAEDHYGSTAQSIGPLLNRENIVCMGYIAGESIEWDHEIGAVEFVVEGAHEFLSRIEANPFRLVIAVDTPDSWLVMPELTVDRALWHLLHWRSNVTALMDFYPTNDTRYAPALETFEGSVWDQLTELAFKKIFARGGVDRLGRLFVEIDPQCVPLADRTWATVMSLTAVDWQARINVRRFTRSRISLLSISGWNTQASGTTNVLYSLSMGHIQKRYGKTELIDQLLAADQSTLNQLAGLYIGWKNLEYEFEIVIPQNNRLIDLYPRQFLALTMQTSDTPRGVAYSGNIVPRAMILPFDPDTGTLTVEVTCEEETFEQEAIDGDIPPSTGWEVDGFDDSSYPDIGMPDLGIYVEIVTLPPDVTNPNHPKKVVIGTSKGIFYTEDFDADNPTWQAMNAGLDASAIASHKQMVVTPSGAIWMIVQHSGSVIPIYGNFLYYASGLGGTWQLVGNASTLADSLGESVGAWLGIGIDPTSPDSVGIVFGTDISFNARHRMAFGTGGTISLGGVYSLNIATNRQKGVVWRDGEWRIFSDYTGGNVYMLKLTGGGGLGSAILLYTAATAQVMAIASGDKYITWDDNIASPDIRIVEDDGTVTLVTTVAPFSSASQGIAMSPTGTYGMGHINTTFTPYKTTDSGASWQSVGGVIPVGPDVWENCKDNNRFIFGGGTVVRLTVDQGTTYVEKSGNLGYVAPLMDVTAIRFIA